MIGLQSGTGPQIGGKCGKCGKEHAKSMNPNDNSFPTWLLNQFPHLDFVGNGEIPVGVCGKSKANECGVFDGFSHVSHISHDISDHDERVAIMIGGGMPADWAHGFAALDPDKSVGGLPLSDWQARLNDALRLADTYGPCMSRLGWSFDRLFGVGRDWLVLDNQAMGWMLAEALAQGGKVIALGARWIKYQTYDGTARSIDNEAPSSSPSKSQSVHSW